MNALFAAAVLHWAAGTVVDDALASADASLSTGALDKCHKALDRALSKPHDGAVVAKLRLKKAVCYLAGGDDARAQVELARALESDALAAFAEKDQRPDIVEALKVARQKVKGTLSLRTNEAASARVDDTDRGPTPLRLTLPVGPHVLEVRTADGRRTSRDVIISSGQETDVLLDLEPVGPPVAVADRPEPVVAPVPDYVSAVPQVATQAPQEKRVWPLPVAVGGGVLVAASVGVIIYSRVVNGAYLAQQDVAVTPTVSKAQAQTVSVLYPIAWVGAGLGAAVAGVGIVGLLTDGEPSVPAVSFVPTQGGGFVSASGRF